MTFTECVQECWRNRELVAEFDRLKGTNLSLKGSPIETEIDLQSGRFESDMDQFFDFVYDTVWSRIPRENGKN